MRALVRLLLLSGLLAIGGENEPSFMVNAEHTLMLSLPRELLDRPKVAKMLQSGLTTTFLMTLRARSTSGNYLSEKGTLARVDVRYEPWDEVFYLTLFQFNHQLEKLTIANFDALVDFFSGDKIKLSTMAGFNDLHWIFQLELKVLPFSESEQAQTQNWFADKLGRNTNKQDPNKVLDLMLATSIKRSPVTSEFWRLEYER